MAQDAGARSPTSRGARPLGDARRFASPPTTSRPPARSRRTARPAHYLIEHGVDAEDFNSYGARRGNHEVMMRGTFANIRIRNEMVPGIEGGVTKSLPDGRADADLRRRHALPEARARRWSCSPARNTAPARRATGRPRAPTLLGVKAVIAESFERIHRSNLVGMGVLPLQFKDGMTRKTLNLDRRRELRPRRHRRRAEAAHGRAAHHPSRATAPARRSCLTCRIDTADEVEYFKNGGILHYVLRNLAQAA